MDSPIARLLVTVPTSKKHIRPTGRSTALVDVKALAVTEWMRSLALSSKTREQVRALLHPLFERSGCREWTNRGKTEASHDEIPLDPAFVAVLSDWRGKRSEGLVFLLSCQWWMFLRRNHTAQILKPKGAEVGILGLGWHTFRHTYRSLLDESGAPIGVQQKLMRHSNVSTTMNVYGRASLRAKQQANSKVVQMDEQENPQAVVRSLVV
jgi:hypothetical protein